MRLVLAALILCLAPAAYAAPMPAGAPIAAGQSYQFDSVIMGEARTLAVYLPDSYADSPDRNYPVVYLVDGGVQQDFLPVAGFAALAGLSGQYQEFILVGVQTEVRNHELTAPSRGFRDARLNPVAGGAAQFRRHLLEEVRPMIAANYRVSGEDVILGESLAGLFIVETFLRAPDSFTHYIAVSPSLWWRGTKLSHEAGDLLAGAEGKLAGRSLYLTIANEGGTMREATDRVAETLRALDPADFEFWYQPMDGEAHNTIYHPATLNALRLTFPPDAE